MQPPKRTPCQQASAQLAGDLPGGQQDSCLWRMVLAYGVSACTSLCMHDKDPGAKCLSFSCANPALMREQSAKGAIRHMYTLPIDNSPHCRTGGHAKPSNSTTPSYPQPCVTVAAGNSQYTYNSSVHSINPANPPPASVLHPDFA
jgi:hypothetical protein